MKAFRNLRTIGALLLLIMAIGTAGYHYIEGWPWFDGFYMVVTTLTTIGYQEVHPLSHAGRVFNVFVILSGVSLLLLGVGALSQALLEFELQSFFGRRRMEREIGRLDGHYIICGLGRVGRSVARELGRKPVPFVILENNEAKRQRFAAENWLVLAGDATQEQTLRQAQIERARGLIAATTTDATNLYIVLTARGIESALEDHCAGQRRCRGKTSAHRWCRCRGFAVFIRWAADRAVAVASACGQLSRHRDHAPRDGSGDRRDSHHVHVGLCGQDD